jgi:peptidase E
METTYILHGGKAQDTNFQNDLFFKEILQRTKLDNIKVLLVHFAGNPERAQLNKQIDSDQFERNKKDKNIEIQIATKEKFIEQMSWADVIYFGGGTTVKLLEELKDFSDLKTHFEGKVIAGESAGANILATLCYSKSGGGIIKCLGILPVFVYPHFEKDSPPPVEQIPDNLQKLFLSNYEFKVIEA